MVDNTDGKDLEKIRDEIDMMLDSSKLEKNRNLELERSLISENEQYERYIIDTEVIYDILEGKLYKRYVIEEVIVINNTSMILDKRIEM